MVKDGIKAAVEEFRRIKKSKAGKYNITENDLNTLGYRLITRKKIKEAIEIFKLNVEEFPKSGNVYDSLAEAYLSDGKTKLAIKFYKKSVEVDPGNNNAKAILKKIEERKKE